MSTGGISGLIVLAVIGAGVLHALWNGIAKHVNDRIALFAFMGTATAIAGGVGLSFTGMPNRPAISFCLASAGIHVIYEIALMKSYGLGAFNQTYPIARGTSPLIVAAGAYLFANENLPALSICGVIVLAAGLMSLAFSSGRLTEADLPAVGAAVLTGLAIAGYTLVDGLGVRRSHDALAYASLLFLLQGPVFPVVVLVRRRRIAWKAQAVVSRGILAGLLSITAYTVVLWAQTRSPLAEVAALRETSVITAALIGALFFKERFGMRRFIAAALVATGIILISA
jgi:drug/metabolite transporter (DMT)-like permease